MAEYDRIMTLHPSGKKGVNIHLDRYNMIKGSIETNLEGNMKLKDLKESVEKDLKSRFEGSIPWYFTAVKQDLEARKILLVEKVNGLQYVSLADPENTR